MSAKILRTAVAALLLAAGSAHAKGAAFQGRVVGVHDGDTLTVLQASNTTVKIRLAEVDAPECGQPWSRNAKKALSDLVYDRVVTVIPDSKSYNRIVGWVTVGSPAVDVSSSLVQAGQVWVYRQYLKRPQLLQIEAQNRQRRAGIWAQAPSELLPPWEWRHSGKATRRRCD